MKQHKKRFWGLIWSTTGLCALLLLLNHFSSQRPIVYAHNPQEQTQQTNNPPREILVNNACSKIDADPKPDDSTIERIRFGDEKSHYFRFWGKSGNEYKITTNIFNGPQLNPVIGVDTMIFLFGNNPLEHPGQTPLAQNDDKIILDKIDDQANDPYESEIKFLATEDRYYWIEVQNRVEGGNGTYCLGIEFRPDLKPGNSFPDKCEPNNTMLTACEFQVYPTPPTTTTATITITNPITTTIFTSAFITANFKSSVGTGPDLDYYKIWAKPGERYICETKGLSPGNDTRMIFYNPHGALLGSNDDFTQSSATPIPVEPGSRSSKAEVNVGYTGWLYILVEPVVQVNFTYGHLYKYTLSCSAEIYHAPIDSHIPPANSQWDAPAPSSSGILPPPEIVAEATATAPVLASKPEVVSFAALPPRTPTPPPAQPGLPVTFSLQIYYDQNNNQQKDADEGVANVPIFLYTGLSDTPIQAITTEGGAIFVSTETASGTVQLFVPYLNINQEISVADVQDIRLRIASR